MRLTARRGASLPLPARLVLQGCCESGHFAGRVYRKDPHPPRSLVSPTPQPGSGVPIAAISGTGRGHISPRRGPTRPVSWVQLSNPFGGSVVRLFGCSRNHRTTELPNDRTLLDNGE